MAAAQASVGSIIGVIIPIIIWGALALFVYFIPSFVAHKKQHIQNTSILLLDFHWMGCCSYMGKFKKRKTRNKHK